MDVNLLHELEKYMFFFTKKYCQLEKGENSWNRTEKKYFIDPENYPLFPAIILRKSLYLSIFIMKHMIKCK